MKLTYNNCPTPSAIKDVTLPERPAFLDYQPNFQKMHDLAAHFEQYSNILVIGHGGSVTSFMGIYGALQSHAQKRAYFLSTVDPDYIAALQIKLQPENTLVIAISKSGETTTQVEALLQFTSYPQLFITSPTGTLAAIGKKLGATIAEHPPIGGRYTGLTEVALLPAALCGFDVEALYEGAKVVYDKYEQTNESWQAASVLSQLEQQGYVDVFMPVYAAGLFPFSNLIVQLCHESFGKNGQGQTYFAHEAPESQHHTNQRFFGGRPNIVGFTISVEHPEHDLQTSVPQDLLDMPFKTETLVKLDKIKLADALRYELEGVLEDAANKKIPMLSLELVNYSSTELGALLAFWQLYAIYGSVLRDVNPFDQPEVEDSKRISFQKRLG